MWTSQESDVMVKDFFKSPAVMNQEAEDNQQDQQKEYAKAKAKVKGLYFQSPVEAQVYDFEDKSIKPFVERKRR